MSARGRTRPVALRVAATPGELAWIAALPCALLLLAAIVLLDGPLGHALLEPPNVHWWPFWVQRLGHLPEPAEHAGFAFALVAPVALAALVLAAAPRRPALPRAAAGALVRASGALLVAFLLVCVAAQSTRRFGFPYGEPPFRRAYFSPATLVVAVALASAAAVALARDDALARLVRAARETPARRRAAVALAALATAVWVLPAVQTDASIATANRLTLVNVPFWLDEPFAVLDGRYPLVDFHAQYAQLLSYAVAAPMALLGASIGVWSVSLVALTALGMLALYALLRRVTGSSPAALALYLPVLATGFFAEPGPLDGRSGPLTYFSMFPIRYGGAYLVAWLTARHVDGAAPRRLAPLALVAGLVLLNNPDFGLPALGATLVAVALTRPPRSRADAARLAGEAALGLLGAAAALVLLTLVVAGALPHPGWLFTFTRLYGVDGFGAIPMPRVGFHLVVYATFCAALVTAAARAAAGARERTLTAMLAWAGIFGLGASAYFVGRSLPEVLISLFSAWALALALLVVVVARALARRPARRPTLPELAVLAGFGLAVCSLAQTPRPWSEAARIGRHAAAPPFAHTTTARFVAAHTHRGERVAILTPVGHRIAYDLGLVNVSPYSEVQILLVEEQLAETLDAMRAAHVRKLFLPPQNTYPEQFAALQAAGFATVASGSRGADVMELVAP